MWATLVLYHLWGAFGLIVGLVLVGVGSVPTACVALLFHGQFRAMMLTIFAVVLLFVVRTLGFWITAKGSSGHRDDELGSELPLLPVSESIQSESGQWIVGQAFTVECESLGVSSAGKISTPVSPERLGADPKLGDAIEIRDIKDPWLATFIYMRAEKDNFIYQNAVGFAWSPDGRYLVVATCTRDGDPDVLAYLDVQERRYIRFIGDNAGRGSCIAWSGRGSYIAVSSELSDEDYPLRLWCFRDGDLHYTEFFNFDKPLEHLLGFRSLAFSPDERSLMVVATVGSRAPNVLAHWEELFLLDVPSLRILHRIKPPAEVCALSWTMDQRHLVVCGRGGGTFILDSSSCETVRLAFRGALCCCHPSNDDLCAFVDHGYITIGRLSDGSEISQQLIAERDMQTLDMCWSLDGRNLYAASGTGRTYIYTLPNEARFLSPAMARV
jgi:hypothetical protein